MDISVIWSIFLFIMPSQNCFPYTESIALWESWKMGSKVANCDNGVGVSIKIWIFLYVFPLFLQRRLKQNLSGWRGGFWYRQICQISKDDVGPHRKAGHKVIFDDDNFWASKFKFEDDNFFFSFLHHQQLLVWHCQQCNFMLEHNLPPSLCYY